LLGANWRSRVPHQDLIFIEQTESSWRDALSEAHRGFILAFIERWKRRG
jgi:hypothetical protein